MTRIHDLHDDEHTGAGNAAAEREAARFDAERRAAIWRSQLIAAEVEAAEVARRSSVEIEQLREELSTVRRQIDNLHVELAAMESTVSWRVTEPLRAIRRRTRGREPAATIRPPDPTKAAESGPRFAFPAASPHAGSRTSRRRRPWRCSLVASGPSSNSSIRARRWSRMSLTAWTLSVAWWSRPMSITGRRPGWPVVSPPACTRTTSSSTERCGPSAEAAARLGQAAWHSCSSTRRVRRDLTAGIEVVEDACWSM